MRYRNEPTETEPPPKLVEGRDYYYEGRRMVFTAHFLTERGYCCGNGCRHCPYDGVASKQKDI